MGQALYSEIQRQLRQLLHLQAIILSTTPLKTWVKTLFKVQILIFQDTNPTATTNTAGTGGLFNIHNQQGAKNPAQGANQSVGQQPVSNQNVPPRPPKTEA